MSELRHVTAIACAALVSLGSIAAPAFSQQIDGTVHEAGTRTPVQGALVILLAADDERRRAVLTTAKGGFSVRAPGPGRFRLRIDRIGYASSYSDWIELHAGEVARRDIDVAVAPVPIPAILVDGEERCVVRPADGLLVARLWNEARKALDATILSSRAVRYVVTRFERDIDARTSVLRDQHIEAAQIVSTHPFISREARQLATRGYIETRANERYYYMPDARALLSDAFLDTHCFALREGGSRPDKVIGLEVRPVGEQTSPDIAGVLWLDRATAELRSFEYGYTRLERSFLQDRIGGWANFERLPTGAWIVRRWVIRTPIIGVESTWFGLGEKQGLVGFHDVGGEVVQALTVDGEPLIPAAHGAVRGAVFDSIRGTTFAGAIVFSAGTHHWTVTDSAGRFVLEGLPRGKHLIGFRHPRLDTLGLDPPVLPIRLQRGQQRRLRLAVPSRETVIEHLCSGRGKPDYDGTAVIRVRNAATGRPLPGAKLAVTWVDRMEAETGALRLPRIRSGKTGSTGTLRACELPRNGTTFTVRASHGGQTSDSLGFILGPHGFAHRDLLVPAPPDTVPGVFSGPATGFGPQPFQEKATSRSADSRQNGASAMRRRTRASHAPADRRSSSRRQVHLPGVRALRRASRRFP